MAAARWDARCSCACWLLQKPVMAPRIQAQAPASVKLGQAAWLCSQYFSPGWYSSFTVIDEVELALQAEALKLGSLFA